MNLPAGPGELAGDEAGGYAVGRRLRWWLGDLDHLLLRLRERRGWRAALRACGSFLRPAGRGARQEVWRFADPLPALREARQYCADLLRVRGSHG